MKKLLIIGLCLGLGIAAVIIYWPRSEATANVNTPDPIILKSSLLNNSQVKNISKPEPQTSFTLVAVGDIMLGRYVETLMQVEGQDYPFLKVEDMLSQADLAIANLEGPLDQTHTQTPNNVMVFSFPAANAALLAKHHIKAVSLANNHAYDQGAENYTYTQEQLQIEDIIPFGHPLEETDDYVATTTLDGQKIALMGFHSAIRKDFDTVTALATVKTAASAHDLTVVMIHWGTEYELHSNTQQQQFAHDMIDAGADMIIGHHPHVTQEIEIYHNKFIAYSLGNFIFDQYFSDATQHGLAINMIVTHNTIAYTLIPLGSKRSQPYPLPPDEATVWLEDLANKSAPELSTDISKGEIVLKF